MEEQLSGGHLLRDLVERIAALEDTVAFLELWCEEQQDALDRIGEPVFFYDEDDDAEWSQPPALRVVDLRDPPEPREETEHDRRVRALRSQIHRLRNGLPARGTPAVGREKRLGL
jgi:hypothetical protein